MIIFDETDVSGWKHTSGLARVSRRLRTELGPAARGDTWPRLRLAPQRGDWVLSCELFSEAERPGVTAFLERRPCRVAALYHDAIPLKHPATTWPKSVERHPAYLKLLSRFDRVWAVSEASRRELLEFWAWQGIEAPPPVDVLALGADLPGQSRVVGPVEPTGAQPARFVSVGILEPRKNQTAILDAFEALAGEGLELELHLVGRVNPHFGKPIAKRVADLGARLPGLKHHRGLSDGALADLVRSARATVFASIAEGCGLPLLESLWLGVPCVCSDIPALAENAAGGGCLTVPLESRTGWTDGLRRLVQDDALRNGLASAARSRLLPTWREAAATLASVLGNGP